MKPQPVLQNNATFRFTIGSLLLVACLVFTINTSAVEIEPTDDVVPSEMNHDFMSDDNQLLHDEAAQKQISTKTCQRSWWGWLTSYSRKPASYHYIDFIELFQ